MGLKQIEPKHEKVSGYDYYITPFPAFKAANLTGELASVLAPLLGCLAPLMADSDKEDSGLMDMDVSKAASAMANCNGISGDKLELLMRKLLVSGNIVVEIPDGEGGEPVAEKLDMDLANELFCGDVQDMFVLCFHVIKLNFNGFFKKFAALSGKEGSAETKKPRKVL